MSYFSCYLKIIPSSHVDFEIVFTKKFQSMYQPCIILIKSNLLQCHFRQVFVNGHLFLESEQLQNRTGEEHFNNIAWR